MRDWTDTADAYALSFARLCAGAVPHILDRAPAPSTALDAGTGTGTVAAALAQAGHTVEGVDAAADMVRHARAAHPAVTFTEASLPDLPFTSGRFDLTVANFVVNHVPEPRAAVAELARVTSPGGRVIVTIWPSAPISAMNALWNEVMACAGATPPPGQRLTPTDDFARTPNGLRSLLAEGGLVDAAADEISWNFVIPAEDLWRGVEAGIATVGATYRAQDEAGQAAMRRAFEEVSGGGILTLPSTAIIATASRR
ncbi:class I SAM-dependent methyltransferase [Microbacterium horticulturae]|uniref:Class I SAM-dependent methyltransferase n=1 Tax=Microbacterium horticulturae TaxID=3028316 RepID=A0ABY8BXH8_9MICO|nr:class I SAM-dependent methyltransferase [Microbacterium sp. KACC 23027]WEG08905.1 class I SAM-dependent methyltransferase [Microbacterium sp. KACC 23027]